MWKRFPLLPIFLALLGGSMSLRAQVSGSVASQAGNTAAPSGLAPGLYAEFSLARGKIVAELFFRRAPLTVASFVGLAEGKLGPTPGKPFFDGLIFHRVVPNYVVQGGDPLGTGFGGPGYEFADEFRSDLRHDAAGILSMANAGPDTNGSQFFFTLKPVRRLDFLHSVFGRVVQGLDLLPHIRQGDAMSVRILRIGPEAEAFQTDKPAFENLAARAPRFPYPFFEDRDRLLPQNPSSARAFQTKLANLHRFTGLPLYVRLFTAREPADANAKPGTLARRFAERFGVKDSGVVAVYYADRREWALWIADKLLPQFNSRGLTLHDAKQAVIAPARLRSEAAFAAGSSGSATPADESQKIKLFVDEIIQGLLDELQPATLPAASAPGLPPR